MRVLAACAACQRQYEVRDLKPGHRFHCACGEIVTVPQDGELHRDALHCAGCGATRQGTETNCRFCQTAFLAEDLDRTTTCPSCFTRITDLARFCDHCGVSITATTIAGTSTRLGCPVCGPETLLVHRQLTEIATDECAQCGGVWLDSARFQHAIEHAQKSQVTNETRTGGLTAAQTVRKQDGPLYRPCPACNQVMNRRNYGGTSGVVIDTCKTHGSWFDADELARVIAWIRTGGLAKSRERQARDAEAAEKRRRERATPVMMDLPERGHHDTRVSGDLFEVGIEALVSVIGSVFNRRW
jgi:Zn-finger nucleic acid-binding protein